MEPTFVQIPEINAVGVGGTFISILSPDARNQKPAIPRLWDELFKDIAKIPNRAGQTCYGIVEMLPKAQRAHPDEMFYIAAAQVLSLGDLPAGMVSRTMPAGKYARFTHKGKLDRLQETVRYVYGSWVPTVAFQLRNAPHLELYDQRFDHASDQSEFDILIPMVENS